MRNLKIFNYQNINIVILIFLLFSCNSKKQLTEEAFGIQKKTVTIFDSIKTFLPALNQIKNKLNTEKDSLSSKDSLNSIKYLGLISDIENIENDLKEWENDRIEIKNNSKSDEQTLNLNKKSFKEILKINSDMNEIKIRSKKLLNHKTSHK